MSTCSQVTTTVTAQTHTTTSRSRRNAMRMKSSGSTKNRTTGHGNVLLSFHVEEHVAQGAPARSQSASQRLLAYGTRTKGMASSGSSDRHEQARDVDPVVRRAQSDDEGDEPGRPPEQSHPVAPPTARPARASGPAR